MPPKPRGRPPKKRRNITNLQNNTIQVLPVVLGLMQIPLSRGGEENFQGSGAALPRRMSKRGNTAQKQHRAINQTVMMAIDVLMNPAAPVAGVAEA
jgi:hypothetical protein